MRQGLGKMVVIKTLGHDSKEIRLTFEVKNSELAESSKIRLDTITEFSGGDQISRNITDQYFLIIAFGEDVERDLTSFMT